MNMLHSLKALRRVFCLACSVTAMPGLAQTPSQTFQPIAPLLQRFVDDRVLAGAVILVADKDKVIDLEVVGCADVAAKMPMKTDDIFWIASISKRITAAAVIILVDEGRSKARRSGGKVSAGIQGSPGRQQERQEGSTEKAVRSHFSAAPTLGISVSTAPICRLVPQPIKFLRRAVRFPR